MKLLDVVNAPWAIVPEQLIEIRGIYESHLRGEKIDIAGVEQRLGRPLKNERVAYEVADGVAVIQMVGVMAQRANLMSEISGGVSTQMIANDIKDALANPQVNAIVLRIDSPGGTVAGTQELAKVIRAAGEKKPVVAYSDGMLASAAYWIAAATSQIVVSGDTVQVGSIGVVTTHVDVSEAEKMRGTKTTEITAGKYKRIASQYGALTEDGRKEIQSTVDYLYEVFVNDVAANRGVSVEKVLSDMADGKMFIGKQAIQAGLVDKEMSLGELIGAINAGEFLNRNSIAAGVAGDAPLLIEETEMPITLESLQAEAPDVYEAVLNAGAAQERARIQGIENHSMPGHEALINQLKFDGKTSPDQAASQILVAEKANKAARLDEFRASAPLPAAASVAQTVKGTEEATISVPSGYNVDSDRAALHAKAKAYQVSNKVDYLTAVRAVSN